MNIYCLFSVLIIPNKGYIIPSMNKRLIIFLILSLLFHLFVILMIKPADEMKPDGGNVVDVDIIKIPKKNLKRPDAKPDTQAERDIDMRSGKKDNEKLESSRLKNKEDEKAVKDSAKGDKKEKVQRKQLTKKEETKKDKTIQKPVEKSPALKDAPVVEKELPQDENNVNDILNRADSDDKDNAGNEGSALERAINNPEEILKSYVPKRDKENFGDDRVSLQAVKYKFASYFRKFSRRIYQVWVYPHSAARRGEDGLVRIKFDILRDGRITNINVVGSSGYPDLDREAVNALKKSQGIPLPSSYPHDVLKVDGYFEYILNHGFVMY